ncbi:YraN family protein [Thiohalorhabdus sp.]|uniref:YraN family protein n=1 Tax=Thiohalorhabdus sp. TaxID=3094134 RepID=UPI002FC31EB1
MSRTPAQRTGDAAEERALKHLKRKGRHRCLVRNYRTRGGEVDLITLEGERLVFVEVRARSDTGYGRPEDTVDHRKRRRLAQAAEAFLTSHPEHGKRACRFDVVAMDGDGLRWIADAFRPFETGFWS